jgi:hypothetical protein
MRKQFTWFWGVVVASAVCGGTVAWAAPGDDKRCAIVLLHGKSGATPSLTALARKLQPLCGVKAMDMPWSERRAKEKEAAAPLKEVAAQVKSFRQQGYKKVLVVGHGFGANTAIAYAGEAGDTDGLIALGPDALADLPGATGRIRQHIPLLWVVGKRDPLFEQGEDHAYGKAPPHPLGRYVVVSADNAGTPEAAVKPVLDWIKSLD